MAAPVEYKNLKRKRDSNSKQHNNSPLAIKKQKLLETRKNLPIWSRAKDIREALRTHNVLVLSGETGSGKSTQVPQFILDEPWCMGKIAITQPRRVAAISLARRVAEEIGCPLGTKVGYSVRFDDNTSASTRVKYLTEGMLLQEMLRDATLSQYSCVVVDEVHERSVDVDLLLGFLKQLVEGKKRKKPLKVVIMSATADVEGIARFFSAAESADSKGGAANEINGTENNQLASSSSPDAASSESAVSICQVEGRQYPVRIHYSSPTDQDLLESAREQIFKIHCKEPMPGDVLVFLTGSETIESLRKDLEETAQNLTNDFPKMLVLPLYAALTQAAQQRIFEKAPPNTRKIILSTNIAETSVTVPGVRFVVDTGKAKMKQYRNRLGLETLLPKPISRSSAEQREGRAGRESSGQCFRLYSEKEFDALEKDTVPEILRCDLSGALLKMIARGADVRTFPLLTPPTTEAMNRALEQLFQLGCLNDNVKITEVGKKVARLPLSPALGRVLLEAAKPERDCLLEVIDIVSCFEVENIWLSTNTEEAQEKANEARAQLRRRQGDHLTYLAAVQAYEAENSDRKRWCDKFWISHRAMRNVMDVRKQLQVQTKHLSQNPTVRTTIDESTQDNILKCFLVGCSSGANIARLCPDKTYKTLAGNHKVAIHPSSVLIDRRPPPEGIIYNEFVYTNKAYGRGVSAIQLRWLEELPACQ